MFYISSVHGFTYGITDTSDNVEEFYELYQIREFLEMGIKIDGAYIDGRRLIISKINGVSLKSLIDNLCRAKAGTPLRVKINENVDYKHCIYLGRDEDKFLFFDGSGVDGRFIISTNFIRNNFGKIQFDFDNNNPVDVTRLLKEVKTLGY